MKTKLLSIALASLMTLCLAPVLSAAGAEHAGHQPAAAPAAGQVHQGRGVLEAINAAKSVITVEHEPIASLQWPKMVMDFKLKSPELLKDVKEGDRVVFDFVQEGKHYIISRIEPAR